MTLPARGLRWLMFAFAGASCAPYLVTVPTGPGRAEAKPVRVEYPPPPAKIEEIYVAHGGSSRCVWRDGYWDWVNQAWVWTAGEPERPKPGCHWVRPFLLRDREGLGFYRPEWLPDTAEPGQARDCTPELCSQSGVASP